MANPWLDQPTYPLWEVKMAKRSGTGPMYVFEHIKATMPYEARKEAERRRPEYFFVTYRQES